MAKGMGYTAKQVAAMAVKDKMTPDWMKPLANTAAKTLMDVEKPVVYPAYNPKSNIGGLNILKGKKGK